MFQQLTAAINNLRIGTRMIGAFLLIALLTAAVGYGSYRSMVQINRGMENVTGTLMPSMDALGDLRAALMTVQRTERSLLATANQNDATRKQQTTARQDAAWAESQEALKRYEALPMGDKEKLLWADFKPLLEQFRRDHQATMVALAAGETDRADKLCAAAVSNSMKMIESLTKVVEYQSEQAELEKAEAVTVFANAKTTLTTLVAVAVAAAVCIGIFLTRTVTRPLEQTMTVLDGVSRGDLDTRDELGQMARALNGTISGLRVALQQDKVDWEVVGKQREQNADFAGQIAAIGKSQAVIEFKLDGTIVSANENFLRTLGYSLQEVQGRHHSTFVEPAVASSSEYRDFWARLNRGESVASDFKRVGKGSKEVWVQASYNPILDLNGKPYKVVKYATDITAAKQLEWKVKEDAAELQQKVAAITTSVNALAAGDFTQQAPDLGTDTVGQMAGSLNKAIVSVRTALEGVREVSEQLADASGQLSAASDEISTGAQEQASSLEETASTLEEITATVKQNSDSAQQARQLASGSKEVAEKGGQVVGNAVEAMSEINQSSKRIADIITTIDEIAFQTNLLALNAAVEAARAGEQGRGFAVVASEVRNLAQRSATSAKEIKSLIEDSVKKVDAGTELVNQSGSTLGEIVTSVKRVTDIITEIAAASKEQSTGIDQVNKAVPQMDTVTQRNASQTEEMSATAQTLTDQAAQLRDLVSRFKLNQDEGGRSGPRLAPRPQRPRAIPATKSRPAAVRSSKNGHAHELDSLGASDGGFTEF